MRCCHIKKDGKQCGGYAMHGSSYCFLHNPDVSKERKHDAWSKWWKWSIKTPENKPQEMEVWSTKDVIALLQDTPEFKSKRKPLLDIKSNAMKCFMQHILLND